jgi:hypothetical protein
MKDDEIDIRLTVLAADPMKHLSFSTGGTVPDFEDQPHGR